jgi:photosystem II stability/assembly factor-like uncharacterized protein
MLLAAPVAGCGGEEPASPSGDAVEHHELLHVHGLGVDPDDDALYVATHSGLYRAADGDQRLRLVGESEQDLMGFTLARTDRYLASGHPAPDDTDQPALLGLIESRDRGRRWTPVSLYGRADFHALEAAGERVYGFDASRGRLMVSADSGRRWAERRPPAAVYSLAVSPRDPATVVASTERGAFMSTAAGRNWRPLDDGAAGLLAWPRLRRLYLVTGDGDLRVSVNGGRTWLSMGNVGGEPVAFEARDDELYVAFSDGRVRFSTDMGHTWSLRAGP